MHMGKDRRHTIAFSGYRTSVKNVELSPSIQHNASADDDSRTIATVAVCDVTETKSCPDLSLNQLTLRMTCGTEPTLTRKEDITPLMKCPVFVHHSKRCRRWPTSKKIQLSGRRETRPSLRRHLVTKIRDTYHAVAVHSC
ncbi:hypothetical protein TNCV_4238101 [Trichonephila clavipes]|nr:hypothetical protein TNCV_4238101 [Trichonephila clavipes]